MYLSMVGSDLLNWNGQDLVLVVDYYSRYWGIEKLYKTDSATVIKKLKHIFSKMGIPEVMRSDNRPHSVHHRVLKSLQRIGDFNT